MAGILATLNAVTFWRSDNPAWVEASDLVLMSVASRVL